MNTEDLLYYVKEKGVYDKVLLKVAEVSQRDGYYYKDFKDKLELALCEVLKEKEKEKENGENSK